MRFFLCLSVVVIALFAASSVNASGPQPIDPKWNNWCTPAAHAKMADIEKAYNKYIHYANSHDLSDVTGIFSLSPAPIKLTLLTNYLQGNDKFYRDTHARSCSDMSALFRIPMDNSNFVPSGSLGGTQKVPSEICAPGSPCKIPKRIFGFPSDWSLFWHGHKATEDQYKKSPAMLAIELQRFCSRVYKMTAGECHKMNLEVCNAGNQYTCQCLVVGNVKGVSKQGIAQFGGSGARCGPIFNGELARKGYDLFLMATWAANNAPVHSSNGAGPLFDDWMGQQHFEFSHGNHVVQKSNIKPFVSHDRLSGHY
eukprot:Nk52_evm9s263 gene=Nk52_evmTU9s263